MSNSLLKSARHESRLRLLVTKIPLGRHCRNRMMAARTMILPSTAPIHGSRI